MGRCIYIIILSFFLLPIKAHECITDSSNINVLEYPDSFNDLVKRFKGKVIYVDLMASWCKPCLFELKELKKLDSFFEENEIIKIYISIDQKPDTEKCVSILNEYDAKGYFVPYTPPDNVISSFCSDIENLFLKNENGEISISIPKYAIVDKEGNVVIRRAKRPSNKDALIEQFKEWIQK